MVSANETKKASLILGSMILLFVLAFFLARSQPTTAKPPHSPDSVLGVFEGITPCSHTPAPVPHISTDTPCEMMIWHLMLNQDPGTGQPTTYTLKSAYGMSQANTTGITGGGVKLDLEGTWAIIQGTTNNPDAVVYQLNPDQPQFAIYFVKMDDNLLHVLTQQKSLMVGNGGWSYTLNRTDARQTTDPTASPIDFSLENTSLPGASKGSSTLGVFDGRTPCAEIVYRFTKFPPDPSCMKIKWRLTLYQDPGTGQPTTYHFKGTQTTGEGTWSAMRGIEAHPDWIIYQLNLDASEPPVFFLRADENHLFLLDMNLNLMVGDALWSYTLSKKS